MKNVPWFIWIAFFIVAGTGWGMWIHDRLEVPSRVQPSKALAHFDRGTTLNSPRSALVNEWDEYHMDWHRVLQSKPALAAEYQQLLAEIHAQGQKVDAAMIQADPKVAPILAKIEAMRKPVAAAAGSSPKPGLSK